MDRPLREGDAGIFGNGIAGDFVVFDAGAGGAPRGRIEAERLGDDVICVGEFRQIVEGWGAAGQDGV